MGDAPKTAPPNHCEEGSKGGRERGATDDSPTAALSLRRRSLLLTSLLTLTSVSLSHTSNRSLRPVAAIWSGEVWNPKSSSTGIEC